MSPVFNPAGYRSAEFPHHGPQLPGKFSFVRASIVHLSVSFRYIESKMSFALTSSFSAMSLLRFATVTTSTTTASKALCRTASLYQQQTRTATKKAGGSTRNGRDSPGQRLGVKKFGGEAVISGNIIIRQRGQKYHSGDMTKMGKDHTIYASAPGYVRFVWNRAKKHQIVTVSTVNPNIPPKDRGVEQQASSLP